MKPEDEMRRIALLVERHERALFEAGADGDPPMIQRIATVVHFIEHGEWAIKWFLRVVAAAAAFVAAMVLLRDKIGSLILGMIG
jgi:hypothetical protein